MAKRTHPTRYAGGLARRDVVAWRNAIFVIFGACGIGLASWVARLPAVRDALEINTQQVGLLILGTGVGSIVGLVFSSHAVARFGARLTIRWCLIIGAISFAGAGVGATIYPNFAVVIVSLAVFGAVFGACDVAMNVSGAANERILGRAIMPLFHAVFSFGTMLGAGFGAVAEALHVPIAVHTAIIAALLAAAGLWAVRSLRSEHIVEDHEEVVPDDDYSKSWRGRLSIWRDPRTLLIGLIILGMAFAEGSANDWLSLAMVDGHGVDKSTGAIIFGVFATAMTIGRIAGVPLLDRFGRVPVLRGSAALATVGLLVVIFVPDAWVAVIGVVAWGLGSALGFPVGMSAAADDPKTAAARVSAVATIGYFAFLVGPPVIGFLGQHFGILHGLLVVLVLVALAGVVSGAARKPGERRPARAKEQQAAQ
jgi:MFS family permease